MWNGCGTVLAGGRRRTADGGELVSLLLTWIRYRSREVAAIKPSLQYQRSIECCCMVLAIVFWLLLLQLLVLPGGGEQ